MASNKHCENSFFCVHQKAVVAEELMFKLQNEDSTATAPLFAEAARTQPRQLLQAITSGTK